MFEKALKNLKKTCEFILLCIVALCFSVYLVACKVIGDADTDRSLLRNVYKNYFSIGAAVNSSNISGKYAALMPNYNSVTAEYEMKWGNMYKGDGTSFSKEDYDFSNADKIISWAKENDTSVRGHTLVWYKSLPTSLSSNISSKEEATAALTEHIETVMTHFGDEVYVWDVVNEAIANTVVERNGKLVGSYNTAATYFRTGTSEFDESGTVDWYKFFQEDYVNEIFRIATSVKREYGYNMDLYYNDYGLEDPYKRAAAVDMIEGLLEDGKAEINGVGLQGHYRLSAYLDDPEGWTEEFENTVQEFTGIGLDVQITELDIRIYDSDGGLSSDNWEEEQAAMYSAIFEICRKYSVPWKEGAGRVTNVTTWGVADDKSSWDTDEMKEMPFLFDAQFEPKKAYYAVVDF